MEIRIQIGINSIKVVILYFGGDAPVGWWQIITSLVNENKHIACDYYLCFYFFVKIEKTS